MELLLSCSRIVLIMAMVVVLIIPVYGQISTPCNASIISSFTPCMNLLTNSTANGTSPSADCCNSLKSLTSGGLDCLCLIVTGSVPFQIPINRSLAISLPRACNMPGVPVQCKASAAPIPAPGPFSPGPTLSPGLSPTPSPKGTRIRHNTSHSTSSNSGFQSSNCNYGKPPSSYPVSCHSLLQSLTILPSTCIRSIYLSNCFSRLSFQSVCMLSIWHC
ncbi:hypothetical protein I3842_02G120700 [Carya illinoinensis]|uniref:Bifunctional inhibitor/plant lipid transfer protein/seed storage helical domain-containing protein n=1 Tax=Carya illinoinensis TaxID=32201 RepID=A0A922FQQ3_CARIL|nr:hypothetical protein I3842_02G120700 [Carya illinoinensis]